MLSYHLPSSVSLKEHAHHSIVLTALFYFDNTFSLSMSHCMAVNALNVNESVQKYPSDTNLLPMQM